MNRAINKQWRKFLRLFFPFHEWHLLQLEDHEYAMLAVRKINYLIEKNCVSEGEIIEVGCGLDNIIANLKYPDSKKLGADIEENVIKAAKILHPFIDFRQATFSEYGGEGGIFDCIRFPSYDEHRGSY